MADLKDGYGYEEYKQMQADTNQEIANLEALLQKSKADYKTAKTEVNSSLAGLIVDYVPGSFYKVTKEVVSAVYEKDINAIRKRVMNNAKIPADQKEATIQERTENFLNKKMRSMNDADKSMMLSDLTEEQKIQQIMDGIPKEEQIRILVENNIDSELIGDKQNSTETSVNEYEKKLLDAQERKENAKARLKQQAQNVIQGLQQVIQTNKDIVAKLEAELEAQKSEADKLRKELSSTKEAQSTKLKQRLEILEGADGKGGTIKEATERLLKARSVLADVTQEATAQIGEIQRELELEQIYINDKGELNEEKEQQEKADEQAEIEGNSYQGYEEEGMNAPKNVVEIYHDLVGGKGFKGKSNSEIMSLMQGQTYQDILETSKHLTRSERGELRRRFEDLIDDKYPDDKTVISLSAEAVGESTGVTLTKENLKNLQKIDSKQLDAICRKLTRYAQKYNSLTPEERKNFDSVMEDLKMAMVIAESRTGKLSRFFRKFGSARRITSLGLELEDVAKQQQAREDAVYNKEDSLRARLGVKTPMPRRQVRVLNTQEATRSNETQYER